MTNIVVPELGESVVEARVAKWLKKEGDPVNIGDPLVELETEKIDLEVSADRAGVLSSIKHAEGADVKGRRSARDARAAVATVTPPRPAHPGTPHRSPVEPAAPAAPVAPRRTCRTCRT